MIRENPILFNTEEVKAILDGRKTVTRRIIKPQPKDKIIPEEEFYARGGGLGFIVGAIPDKEYIKKCAPYQPSDTTYVCEAYCKMQEEAARIWLRVTDVRVERLQDITPEQIVAEGIGFDREHLDLLEGHWDIPFAATWDATIKKSNLDRYGWAANPWVWVVEFERCEKPESEV